MATCTSVSGKTIKQMVKVSILITKGPRYMRATGSMTSNTVPVLRYGRERLATKVTTSMDSNMALGNSFMKTDQATLATSLRTNLKAGASTLGAMVEVTKVNGLLTRCMVRA